ncbi:MAG: M48 family metallopeptidase [Blastocatellia bacterium]
MRKKNIYHPISFAVVILLTLMPFLTYAQATRVEAPKNKYSLAQDIELGRQAAAEVEKQMPLYPEDSEVDAYVERVGRRLVAAIPSQFQHQEFNYRFDVVNASDINAFALPGGPMYVNRGMIEAARTEGEMAGVMAHEISHVALRHGTAQATKQQNPGIQLGAIGGAILGAIIGGNAGSVIAQGTQLGLGAYLLRYSRDYETQADILGAQIMARAGYDPRDLANMFRTIEQQGGGGGPEWLSSHPNPGNRYNRINEEAERLNVNERMAQSNTAEFNRVRSSLRSQAPAQTMEQIVRNRQSSPSRPQYPNDSRIEQRVETPSSQYRTYRGGNLFQLAVPENWRQFGDDNSITFAPQGAFGNYQGQSVFTHGAMVGVANAPGSNLRDASARYVNALLQNNSYLRVRRNFWSETIDGRNALGITLGGQSPITGRNEVVNVHTVLLRNGALFYVINVAPNNDYGSYNTVFQRILNSVNLNS